MHNELYVFYKRFTNLIIKSSKYILISSIIFILITSYNINIFQNIYKSYILSNEIKVCVCTVGKKENKYIKEFVQHYKDIGVDKIFLYDNNDMKGEKFEPILSQYIKEGFIEIFDYRGQTAAQLKLMRECYDKNKNIFDWFIFFDTDEFLHLSNSF